MRAKDKKGLTHQQELFCQYVVDAYDTNTKGVLVTAYRMAYNCSSDAKVETHYSNASRLMSDSKIIARVEELRAERARLASISREEMINRDAKIVSLDPLKLWIFDEKIGNWRLRYLHEISKDVRVLLKFVRVGKRLIPDIDKDAAAKRLIEVLGLSSTKELSIKSDNNFLKDLKIGFGNKED